MLVGRIEEGAAATAARLTDAAAQFSKIADRAPRLLAGGGDLMRNPELFGLRQLFERLRPPLLPPPVGSRGRRAEVVGRRAVPGRAEERLGVFGEEVEIFLRAGVHLDGGPEPLDLHDVRLFRDVSGHGADLPASVDDHVRAAVPSEVGALLAPVPRQLRGHVDALLLRETEEVDVGAVKGLDLPLRLELGSVGREVHLVAPLPRLCQPPVLQDRDVEGAGVRVVLASAVPRHQVRYLWQTSILIYILYYPEWNLYFLATSRSVEGKLYKSSIDEWSECVESAKIGLPVSNMYLRFIAIDPAKHATTE